MILSFIFVCQHRKTIRYTILKYKNIYNYVFQFPSTEVRNNIIIYFYGLGVHVITSVYRTLKRTNIYS